MECSIVFKCECNNKHYPSQTSLKSHKKTKGHKQWEEQNELRELKIKLTLKDNKILSLENKVNNLRELNTHLLNRINLDNGLSGLETGYVGEKKGTSASTKSSV